MRVAIIGFGRVGGALGAALLRCHQGFKIIYGVRHPSAGKYETALAQLPRPGATVASVHEAVTWAEAIILATPGRSEDAGIQALAASLGAGARGKVLLDATNPLTQDLQIRWGRELSGGEVLAAALPDTAVYKAFNTIGVEHMGAADGRLFGGERLTMLLAGDEHPARRRVAEAVVAGVGFFPVYVGGIRYARNLEAIAELYIGMGRYYSTPEGMRPYHLQFIRSGGR